jgi:hypothetical protein
MLVTNHVLSGAVIGAASRRRPAAAFAVGVLSHFALDAAPHWGAWEQHEADRHLKYELAAAAVFTAVAAGLLSGRRKRASVRRRFVGQ